MKDWLRIIGLVLFVIAVIWLGISWDIYRWHTFQQVTHSDIGYWKWHFVFDSHTHVRTGK